MTLWLVVLLGLVAAACLLVLVALGIWFRRLDLDPGSTRRGGGDHKRAWR